MNRIVNTSHGPSIRIPSIFAATMTSESPPQYSHTQRPMSHTLCLQCLVSCTHWWRSVIISSITTRMNSLTSSFPNPAALRARRRRSVITIRGHVPADFGCLFITCKQIYCPPPKKANTYIVTTFFIRVRRQLNSPPVGVLQDRIGR